MIFEFATSQHIVFGSGTIIDLPKLCKGFGKSAAVITGKNTDRIEPILNILNQTGYKTHIFSISGEPTISAITELSKQLRETNCDFLIAIGGGSVIDAGKAAAAMLTNPGHPLDYLEVIGKGLPLRNPPAPFAAVPTTAGTGAEATRNAVLLSEEHRVKVSMRSPQMLPTLALIDPELTLSMPPEVTAATGLDALTQLIEAFTSAKANPLTDGICREGIRRAAEALPRAYTDGSDLKARESMALASLFGGIALANAGLGAVHGFAGPMGGMFSVPHGTVCAALLPAVIKTNIRLTDDLRYKFEELACMLTGNPNAQAEDATTWTQQLCTSLNIPGLAGLGINKADFPHIVDKAKNASSMKGNPVKLTDEQLLAILNEAY